VRIYTMTATFGKLEHQTITFTPGLNVIHAPNEWGKSTWCAFICAMLYGIDTRERTKQGVIADKERYLPWSGSPMSGRMDLCWQGKDITIERSTKGRAVFGEFRAYETATGLPVTELTAGNCGEVLLGVEKSVFTRSAFIRQADLPVGEDEALRRRLNALVTTGDETGASDDLAEKLKNLKNKCRHNKTGLLPQAEAQREQLQQGLAQLCALQAQTEDIQNRQAALDKEIQALENHKAALAWQEAQADREQVQLAWENADLAARQLEIKQAECSALPDRCEAQNQILHLEQLMMDRDALEGESIPKKPEAPIVPNAFLGLSPQAAVDRAYRDKDTYDRLSKKASPLLPLAGIAALLVGVALSILVDWLLFLPCPVICALCLILYFRSNGQKTKQLQALMAKYPGLAPDLWSIVAKDYAQAVTAYEAATANYNARIRELETLRDHLGDMIAECTGGISIHEQLNRLRDILNRHDDLQRAEQTALAAQRHAQTLAAMAKPAEPPKEEDYLTCDIHQTEARLLRDQADRRQLELQRGQLMGQMEALGSVDDLTRKLCTVEARITRLESIYSATALAMETLSEASAELQRKFAPRISRQAQAFFSRMTDGRYDRLLLDRELNLHTAATGEDHLRPDLWRSEGTMDQLYLSLRLAVAAELTPESPLVLDDAFVRFDDTRLARAMELLKHIAENQQVILFTCQTRENNHL